MKKSFLQANYNLDIEIFILKAVISLIGVLCFFIVINKVVSDCMSNFSVSKGIVTVLVSESERGI